MRRQIALFVSITLVATVAALGAHADAPAGDFSNLEPVYSYSFPTPDGMSLGTDVEFFTTTVPVRDGDGQIILDGSGAPVTEERDFAVAGAEKQGAFIFDITDPENISFVVKVVCNQIQNDPQLKRFGDRWILALTQDEAGVPCLKAPAFKRYGTPGVGGIALFDVTDPVAYSGIYAFATPGGAHNFTWHPTQPFGWVSTGDLPGGRNHLPIIDFTDLTTPDPADKPALVADLQTVGGPHDISFNPDGTRAYVANENHVRIFDSTNPAAPVLIGATPGTGTYAHTAETTDDGSTLVVTQESLALGGFFVAGSAVCPGEGLFFYDIAGANEEAPAPLGVFYANITGPLGVDDPRACTAHQGRISPNGRAMTVGWYAGGARVVDISNRSVPREVGHAVLPGAEVWSARTYKGPYVYIADLVRGFDVVRWTGAGPAPWL
jgi:hypothetical protein